MAAAVVISALAFGCNERRYEEHHIWTMFEIRKALVEDGNVAKGRTWPNGFPASEILTAHGDGPASLKVIPAFAEGRPAAFVTTEIWINYDEVWAQPAYLQVVTADPLVRLEYSSDGRPAPPLVDVGPRSTFYSPFWTFQIAVVGERDAEFFKDTRQLLNTSGVAFLGGPSIVCPLAPFDVLAAPAGQPMVEPTWGTTLDGVPAGEVMFDGDKVGVFDFGSGLFAVDANAVVEPLPAFVFYAPDATGAVVPLNAWRVHGVGPLFSGRAADVGVHAATGWPQPRFGAYWRLYKAMVGGATKVFRASDNPQVAPVDVDLKEYEGRVALNGACFDALDFPTSCAWLDSQERIERLLPSSSIIPTEITETSPFVFYDKKPVKR
jgi:hypothetical protein